MLNVKLFEMQNFLPQPYEEELAPRLREAQEKLQTGSGAGGASSTACAPPTTT